MEPGKNEAAELCAQMAAIRHQRHRRVRETVVEAEAAADLGRYIWNHPWIMLSAVAAVGYLMSTSKHLNIKVVQPQPTPSPPTPCAPEPSHQAVAQPSHQAVAQPSKGLGHQLLLSAGSIALPLAVSLGRHLVLQWLEPRQPTPEHDISRQTY